MGRLRVKGGNVIWSEQLIVVCTHECVCFCSKMRVRCDECGGWGAHHPGCQRTDEDHFLKEESPNAYTRWLNESFDLSPMEPVGGLQMEMEEWRTDEVDFGQLMPELSPQTGRWWQGGAWANLYVPMPDLGEPEVEMV